MTHYTLRVARLQTTQASRQGKRDLVCLGKRQLEGYLSIWRSGCCGCWLFRLSLNRNYRSVLHEYPEKTHSPRGNPARGYTQTARFNRDRSSQASGVTRKTLSALINCKASMSPEMALRVARATKTSPESWLYMQAKLDLWIAEQKPPTVQELAI